MIGRVSTFGEVGYLMTLNMTTQAKESAAQTEESSGVKAQTYGALGGDVSRVLNIDNQITQLTSDGDNATTALSTMQESYSVMSSVTSLGTTMLSDLSAYMSAATTDTSSLASSAQSWLTQLTNMLNTKYAGSYLFSGTSTDTAPVNTSAAAYTPTDDPTTADTDYYQGAPSGKTYVGSDGYTVSTSVQADSTGFEQMLRGLSMIVADPTDSATITAAYSLIQSGSSAVATSQATLSTASAALTSYQSDAAAKVTALSTLATGLTGADLSAATVLVTNYSTQLEASYSMISKLMSDNLSKYLT